MLSLRGFALTGCAELHTLSALCRATHGAFMGQSLIRDFHRSMLRQDGEVLAEVQTVHEDSMFLMYFSDHRRQAYNERFAIAFKRSDVFLIVGAKLAKIRDELHGKAELIHPEVPEPPRPIRVEYRRRRVG